MSDCQCGIIPQVPRCHAGERRHAVGVLVGGAVMGCVCVWWWGMGVGGSQVGGGRVRRCGRNSATSSLWGNNAGGSTSRGEPHLWNFLM